MEALRFNTTCISCIYNKFMKPIPEGTDELTRLHYAKGILRILADADDMKTAPELVAECTKYKNDTFGTVDDYADLKVYYNRLMQSFETEISAKIAESENPLHAALCYALLGNYIDFGAMDSVDDEKLKSLIGDAESIELDEDELERLFAELDTAQRLVYLTDNCGEIVFDKLFINELMCRYPRLEINVLVRGDNVLNDATMADAEQIGLTGIVPVFGNGTAIAGTCIDRLPTDIREKVLGADVIIAKGQGNFETLCYSRMNIYYLFMCKCKMFADRFGSKRLRPMLLNDLRMQ